ncbi:polysaccharide deacetylase family protein [Ekhidna sp.]|uniref:polysaccharide deacetylase family protein n=1 Tax=Ekhidna sp. TaxID=2608089 RepID=UPI00329934D3
MRMTVIFLALAVSQIVFAQQKRMCVTVDDLPLVKYGIKTEGHEEAITEGLLAAFKKHNVPAIGYVNENKVRPNGQPDERRVKLLERWLEEGYELGNHTYSHKNFNRVPFEEYTTDVIKGEKIIKELALKYKSKVEYFRHPYLRIGERKSQADSLNQFLADNGYTPAPVTIDNEEYLFAKAYAVAYKNKDIETMKRVGEAYLEYMENQLLYFEKASMDLLDRNMDHTLLIHANYLNSVYLDALLTIFENHGYTFISQSEVLEDPAYEREISKYNDWGISWIQWWGISQGLKGEFFEGEAQTPEFVKNLSN